MFSDLDTVTFEEEYTETGPFLPDVQVQIKPTKLEKSEMENFNVTIEKNCKLPKKDPDKFADLDKDSIDSFDSLDPEADDSEDLE